MNDNMIEMIVMIATIIGAIAAVIGTYSSCKKRKKRKSKEELKATHKKKEQNIQVHGNNNRIQYGKENINTDNNSGSINIQR
jgi:predicted small secreted protein